MTDRELFTVVGIRPSRAPLPPPTRRARAPRAALLLLGLIALGCLLAPLLTATDPTYLDLAHCNEAPSAAYPFGTDPLGRDIFSGIWYGGRVSITVGLLATALSTIIAILYGTVCGMAPRWLDGLLMRFTELVLSVPGLLLVMFLQAIVGSRDVLSLCLVLGLTGWAGIARVVRTEVRQLRVSEFVIASRCMGGGFFHVLVRHFLPNFFASISFMVVMNVSSAIAAESTLSFLGMGLPLEVVSWGSMLSLAQNALLCGSWWTILIPGGFLVTLLMCLTSLGAFLRRQANRGESNLA